VTPDLIGTDSLMQRALISGRPSTRSKKEREKKEKKGKNRRYSLTSGIHQVELTTMVHDLWYNWILPDLMYNGGNLWVKHETFCGAAPVSDATDINAVDDCG
jgi:hypothetical protein